MNLEDIRNKYQCDETFAQWKEWVRKNKPSHAETHIVTAVAPNGSKFEKLIGGYTDAQNSAFSLVAHGYKNVKMFKSVNAGPMKLLRNFSAPLHGAKFKDSDVSTDAQDDKKFFFQVFTRNGKLISKIKAPDTISTSIATRLAEQESKKFKKNWYKCQIVDQNGRSYETYYNKVPSYNGTRELAQKNIDSVDEIRQKYANDGFLNVDKETRRKIISYLKTRWKLDDAKTNRFIRDFDRDLGDLVKDKEPWDRITKFIDGRVKKIDVNPYSNSYGHSLIAQKYKKPGKDKLRSKDSEDEVDSIRQKYAKETEDSDDFAQDKLLITSKGFARANEPLKKDTRKGLKPFEVAFFVKGKDGKPFKTVRSKMAASLEEAKRWANQESRKYNGVTKVDVKEFKDEADYIELIRAKYSVDAYNLGISKTEIDPKAPLKVLSVTAKKEPDGISGSVSFTKGNKKVSERFMVYNSGNWDKKPFGSSAYGYSASDRETLMNAVRNKLSTMGIKAK